MFFSFNRSVTVGSLRQLLIVSAAKCDQTVEDILDEEFKTYHHTIWSTERIARLIENDLEFQMAESVLVYITDEDSVKDLHNLVNDQVYKHKWMKVDNIEVNHYRAVIQDKQGNLKVFVKYVLGLEKSRANCKD